MTLLKSGSTQATKNGTVENMFASIAETDAKYALCRIYEQMIEDGDFDLTPKFLLKKYPEVTEPRVLRTWCRGIKPRSWDVYRASQDPDCSLRNLELIMRRYDISKHTARRAIRLTRPADPNYRPPEDEVEDMTDYGWPSPKMEPSPLTPLLRRWMR